jgi:limonene 1,2-monooxygenase
MTFRPRRMQFGIFMPPHHHLVGENPTLAFDQDLEFLAFLDHLGFDEAWIGEHHSGATEIFASPEILIGAASQRTRYLRLGSGVVNLPMHHPFHVADRMVMLDHLTHGRVMLGVGSGARWADFRMLGYDPAQKARMSAEAIAAIVALIRADAPVSMKTDWFELREARLQLASFQQPHLPIAVAGSSSVDDIPAAGRHGLWQITPGYSARFLREFWERVERGAAQYGQQVSREHFRAMKFVHLAESRAEALEDVRAGLKRYHGLPLVGLSPDGDPETRPEQAVASGAVIIGTPDDMIDHLEGLLEGSGGFGGFLAGLFGLANREKTMKSFELWAKWVAPRFQSQYVVQKQNWDWVVATKGGPNGQAF